MIGIGINTCMQIYRKFWRVHHGINALGVDNDYYNQKRLSTEFDEQYFLKLSIQFQNDFVLYFCQARLRYEIFRKNFYYIGQKTLNNTNVGHQ